MQEEDSSVSIDWASSDEVAVAAVERLITPSAFSSLLSQVMTSPATTTLGSLTQGLSNSLVVLLFPDDQASGVLKLGESGQIVDEYRRYIQFAHPLHPGDLTLFPPATVANTSAEGFLAILYRSVGNQTFGRWLSERISQGGIADVSGFLDVLMERVSAVGEATSWRWHRLSDQGCYFLPDAALDAYMAYWSTRDTSAQLSTATLEHTRALFDPARVPRQPSPWCLTHGDFNTDNILVSPDETATVIDFAASGPGHYLRDLITLEAHLVFRALAPTSLDDDGLTAYWASLSHLYEGDFLPDVSAADVPAAALVARIRRFASERHFAPHAAQYASRKLPSSTPMAEYLYGILRHLIRLVSRPDSSYGEAGRWLAASAALVIADRIVVDNLRNVIRLKDEPSLPGTLGAAPQRIHQQPSLPRRSELIGRDGELDDILARWREQPITTIVAEGGAGKTSVALELAWQLSTAHDVRWVALDDLEEGDLLWEFVAVRLGIAPRVGITMRQAVVDRCATAEHVLVLDNCEHLRSEVAQLALAIVSAASRTRIIATSREPLGLPQVEFRYRLNPLAVPRYPPSDLGEVMSYPSAQLFVRCAQRRWPEFAVRESDTDSLADLCRRLDGLPLNLELAAGWAGVMSVQELVDGLLEHSRILVADSAFTSKRHNSVDATIRWSYDLLTEDERTVWRRLSLFSGGASLPAIRSVCSPTPPTIDAAVIVRSLCDKSLVHADLGEPSRFRLLETLRAFAHDALDVDDPHHASIVGRYIRWYTDYASRFERLVRGPNQAQHLRMLDAEHENLWQAVLLSEHVADAKSALGIVAALWRYWRVRGYLVEARALAERITTIYQQDSTERARALCTAGNLAYWQKDYVGAVVLLDQAVAVGERVHDHEWAVPFGLLVSGMAKVEEGDDLREAKRRLEKSRSLWNAQEDATGRYLTLYWLSACQRALGERGAAQELERQCELALASVDDVWARAHYRLHLATRAEEDGQADRALSLYEQSLATWRELGDREGIATSCTALARLARRAGRSRSEAVGLLLEALDVWGSLKSPVGLADALEVSARLLDEVGHYSEAVELASASIALRPESGTRRSKRAVEEALERELAAFAALPRQRLAIAEAGRALRLDLTRAAARGRELIAFEEPR
jgi:predicted ATPase